MSLIVDNVSVSVAGRSVVQNVSLIVKPGKATAVLGANGAGKSELVLGIAGMLPLSGTSICINGIEVLGSKPEGVRRNGIAAVPEGHRIFANLDVEDNLRAAGSMLSNGQAESLERVFDLFPELAEMKRQLAGTMSGGQQQMLAIGHALMCKPKYLLIDEMSLGLAPLIVKRLVGVLKKLKTMGVGILLIEQFADLALDLCEDAIVLRGGNIQYSGPSSVLKLDKNRLDEAYFGTGTFVK